MLPSTPNLRTLSPSGRRLAARTGMLGSALAFAISLFVTDRLPAQDRVTFVPEGASGPITEIGEVIDYNGRELIVRTINGTQRLPSAAITGIETNYEPLYLQGIENFRQGDTAAAQTAFRGALERELRPWVQREIHAWLMKAALRQYDYAGAIREFREIVLHDPQTRHWGIAPLIWSPMAIGDSLRSDMAAWLKSDREAERMLAASLLLLDPLHGEAAEMQLNRLARDTNPILSAYAKCQLWRLAIASRMVSDITLEAWRDAVARLPEELRSGPQYLLARGYESRGELRLAAAEALWLPLVYSEYELLAARALSDAAEHLQRSGLTIEPRLLELEVLQRYPWSREASQLRGRPTAAPAS